MEKNIEKVDEISKVENKSTEDLRKISIAEKININEFTQEQLEKYIENLGEKKFHAKQIFKWVHRIGVLSFDDMTDISKTLRDKLKENTYILNMEVIECQKSKKDGTMKFLIKLTDNAAIETVFMKYNHRKYNMCIDSSWMQNGL